MSSEANQEPRELESYFNSVIKFPKLSKRNPSIFTGNFFQWKKFKVNHLRMKFNINRYT